MPPRGTSPPAPHPTLEAARRLTAAGLSVIRVRTDGTKAAVGDDWRDFSDRKPTDAELVKWFQPGRYAIGVPGGPASGNLAVLDFERLEAWEKWRARVETVGLAAEVEACPLVETGGGGRHLYCRVADPVNGHPLAFYAVPSADPDKPGIKKQMMIEVRGNGQMVVAPGSPPHTHRSGRPYTFLREGWAIEGAAWEPMTLDVWNALCSIAEGLNEYKPPEPEVPADSRSFADPVDGDAPGSDFNRRGRWEDTGLAEAGWRWVSRRRDSEVGYMVRPGKDEADGKSASVGVIQSSNGWPLFWSFSTSAEGFRPLSGYSRFAVFAILKHGGNYSAAAKRLREMGYGGKQKKARQQPQGQQPAAGGMPPAESNGVHPSPPPAPPPPARRLVAEYEGFPTDLLPPILRDYVESIRVAVDCDPVYATLPCLALVSAAIGGALVASPKYGWEEPPSLWACVVADSGTAKSPAAAFSLKIAEEIEDGLADQHASKLAEWERRIEDGSLNKKENPAPVREYFRADNVTIERLTENLSTSPRGLFAYSDELAAWFGRLTAYKGRGGGSDVSQWLSLFDGGPVSYQRRTGQPRDVRVSRGVVTVAGGIQPAILARCMGDESYTDSGLAARLVFTMPPKRVPRWSDHEINRDVYDRFRGAVQFLRKLPFDRTPGTVPLAFDALALFKAFNNATAENAEGYDGGPMAAALPKMIRIALRLALIHYSASAAAEKEDPGRGGAVPEESMIAGIEMAKWFTAEAGRVYSMLAEGPTDRDARLLGDLIRRKGGRISARGLVRSNARRYPTMTAAEAALDALVSAGFGAWRDVDPGPGGGRPGHLFELAEPVTRVETDRSDDDSA